MTISSRGPTLEPGMLSVRMGGKTADTVPPPPSPPAALGNQQLQRLEELAGLELFVSFPFPGRS